MVSKKQTCCCHVVSVAALLVDSSFVGVSESGINGDVLTTLSMQQRERRHGRKVQRRCLVGIFSNKLAPAASVSDTPFWGCKKPPICSASSFANTVWLDAESRRHTFSGGSFMQIPYHIHVGERASNFDCMNRKRRWRRRLVNPEDDQRQRAVSESI